MIRVVLDTNVVVSALLFDGLSSRLVDLWQQQRFLPIVSKPILQEYLRVLSYPKFKLTAQEVRQAIEELLPYVEVASPKQRLRVIRRDPADNRFLECAVAGKAHYLVSGDDDLLSLKSFRQIRIVSVAEFLAILWPDRAVYKGITMEQLAAAQKAAIETGKQMNLASSAPAGRYGGPAKRAAES